jgi:AraC family transcriptional activator of mtrCDE
MVTALNLPSPDGPCDDPQARAREFITSSDLDGLTRALDIELVALTEILVPRGYRAEMGKFDAPAIHYNLAGSGRISVNGGPFHPLKPHLLIIVPPKTRFTIEVDGHGPVFRLIGQDCWKRDKEHKILRISVPDETGEVVQICGFFNASFGPTVGLFRDLAVPVLEQFEPNDKVDVKLREIMSEVLAEDIGTRAMTAALLKQVIIALIRRSIRSADSWAERFTILRDRQITRALADMVARPGAAHTVASLASLACLSRSAFMARFIAVLGHSPMAVLRDLRMRQAASDLQTASTSIEVIAHNAGYESRSSFVRAFKKAYGQDPTEYRAKRPESRLPARGVRWTRASAGCPPRREACAA